MNTGVENVDILILGNTLTGICLRNLLQGRLGNSFKILIMDVTGCESIHQDTFRYANMPEISKTPNEKGFLYNEAIVENSKKIFIDENMNKIDVKCSKKFPYGDIFGSISINEWFVELDFLSKHVRPKGISLDATSDSSEIEIELDNITVRKHMNRFIKSSIERKTVEEIVWELCGVSADKVSVLFFLWIKNKSQMGMRYKKPLDNNISYRVNLIKNYKDNQVLVETDKGSFACSILAMALKPVQIKDVTISDELWTHKKEQEIVSRMYHGVRRGFTIAYKKPVWRKKGYSGEAFSLVGAVRSITDETSNFEISKVYTICGHLRTNEDGESVKTIDSNKEKVISQLSEWFGDECLKPIYYMEECYDFIEVPQLGDFTELLNMLSTTKPQSRIEWSCLDIYNNCDVDQALFAAQRAFVKIVYTLRPQAIAYEELVLFLPKTKLPEITWGDIMKQLLWKSLKKTAPVIIVTSAVYMLLKYLIKSRK